MLQIAIGFAQKFTYWLVGIEDYAIGHHDNQFTDIITHGMCSYLQGHQKGAGGTQPWASDFRGPHHQKNLD